MTQNDDVEIVLTSTQIEQVIRSVGLAGDGARSSLLMAALDNAHTVLVGSFRSSLHKATQRALVNAVNDPQLSQSLLRGLSILSCYGPQRPWLSVTDLAEELDMPPSTTHRYVRTLRAVGLVEQDLMTRRYRPVDVRRRA